LLPANPGLHGFEDSIKSGALIIGSTVHFINSGMDTGPQIMQAACSLHHGSINLVAQRHLVFAQQVASLIQVNSWLNEGRIEWSRAGANTTPFLSIRGVTYTFKDGFAPELEPCASAAYAALLADA
jgi:phosphoribosylglycinamide formyltransferase-1